MKNFILIIILVFVQCKDNCINETISNDVYYKIKVFNKQFSWMQDSINFTIDNRYNHAQFLSYKGNIDSLKKLDLSTFEKKYFTNILELSSYGIGGARYSHGFIEYKIPPQKVNMLTNLNEYKFLILKDKTSNLKHIENKEHVICKNDSFIIFSKNY